MTMQAPDTIFFCGNEFIMFDEPLSCFPTLPKFSALSTANRRGYVAAWAIICNRLFLVSLTGYICDDKRNSFDVLFPAAQEPVFAEWFSGELKLHRGRSIKRYENAALYEHEVLLSAKNGLIYSQRSIKNEYVPNENIDPTLLNPVSSLDDLNQNTLNRLSSAGIKTIGDLVAFNGLKLAKTANLTIDEAIEVKEAISWFGLTFAAH